MSDLFGNPEDRFSHVAAQLMYERGAVFLPILQIQAVEIAFAYLNLVLSQIRFYVRSYFPQLYFL